LGNEQRNATKLQVSDGAVLGTFNVGNFPFAIAFDGANVWVTNSNSGTVSEM
jgi:DNA-binding beta-propeller fold protein YncE